MAITDQFVALETAVKNAQEKGSVLEKATMAKQKAEEEYSKSVAEVEKLKQELTGTISNIFQPNIRVRQSQ